MARLQCTYRQAHSAAQKKIGKAVRTGEWQYEYWLDGKFWFKATIPDSGGHHTGPILPGTLNSILRQLHLDREEFIRWRDCPMDGEEYERIIRERLK